MNKLFIILVLSFSFFIVSCNGERVSKPPSVKKTRENPVKTANYVISEEDQKKAIDEKREKGIFSEENITGLEEKLDIGNGYYVTGHFDLDSLDQNKGPCIGVIYRKEFEESYLYVLVDCNDNETRHIVRK